MALAAVSFALAFALILRAIDTGSIQQYFGILVLVGFAINRVYYYLIGYRHGAHS